jgi:hypothetical protein
MINRKGRSSMNHKSRFLSLGSALIAVIALSMFFVAPSADADIANINLSYVVKPTGDTFSSGISDIIIFNSYDHSGGAMWPSSVDQGGGTINDPFQKSTQDMPKTGLILGLVQNGADHIVLMGTGSGPTITTAYENTLISALQFAMRQNFDGLDSAGQATYNAAFNTLNDFYTIYSGFSFTLGSLPSSPSPGLTVETPFTVMQLFPEGNQEIGSGIAKLQYNPPSPVPIPSAVWLLGSGFLGLIGMRRKIS